jgi:hypothetical protein
MDADTRWARKKLRRLLAELVRRAMAALARGERT